MRASETCYCLTGFIPNVLVRKRARSRFAKEYDSPFSALRKLQALVVDLMRKFACRCHNDGTDARPGFRLRLRYRTAKGGHDGNEVG